VSEYFINTHQVLSLFLSLSLQYHRKVIYFHTWKQRRKHRGGGGGGKPFLFIITEKTRVRERT
jgi:hypothetical protein